MKIRKNGNQGSKSWYPGNNIIFTLDIRRHYDNLYGNTVMILSKLKNVQRNITTKKHRNN